MDMQCPSTRRALSQTPAERAAHNASPLPDCRAVKDAKTMEEAVGARRISYAEVKLENQLRYNRGAVLAQLRKEPDASSVDKDKRERAIAAFAYVRVKFKDLMRMSGLADAFQTVKHKFYGSHED